jgi:hypothetical protein
MLARKEKSSSSSCRPTTAEESEPLWSEYLRVRQRIGSLRTAIQARVYLFFGVAAAIAAAQHGPVAKSWFLHVSSERSILPTGRHSVIAPASFDSTGFVSRDVDPAAFTPGSA